MKIVAKLSGRKILGTAIKTVAAAIFLLFAGSSTYAQEAAKVDHLTAAEDEIIHDTQELDKRIEIFVKVIDRRFTVLGGATAVTATTASKENKEAKKKDADKWGQLPTGTRTELLGDVKSVLEEAVRNIDNAAEHDPKNALLPKALKTLSDGCSRFASQLKPLYVAATSETERGLVYDAAANCREIMETDSKRVANPTK